MPAPRSAGQGLIKVLMKFQIFVLCGSILFSKRCIKKHLLLAKRTLLITQCPSYPRGRVFIFIHCFSVITFQSDYFEFFTEYATEEFVRENFDKDFYYAISDSKIYFLPNEFMGHDGYGSSYLIVEKIDNLTYFIYDPFFGRENIIEFIDGKYKVSHIYPEFAMNRGNNIDDNYVKIPELSDLTLSEAEEKLNSVGLKLDRNNITYVNSNWCVEGKIVTSKYMYRYVAPGAAVGVYVSSGDYNS